MTVIASHCWRCLAPAPAAAGTSGWHEFVDDDGGLFWVCLECITPDEETRIEQATMSLADKLQREADAYLDEEA